MTCKDCIFNEICERREDLVQLDDFTWDEYGESNEVEEYCSIFRNKADFVEVVRCRDCRHSVDDICKGLVYCNEHQKSMREKDFCSYGERKKDG
jgi:hypothetical protein